MGEGKGWKLHTCQRGDGDVMKREGRLDMREIVQTEEMRAEEMALVMWWW